MKACVKCKSQKIYHAEATKNRGAAKLFLGAFSSVMLSAHICTECGFVEHYVENPSDLEKISKKYNNAQS